MGAKKLHKTAPEKKKKICLTAHDGKKQKKLKKKMLDSNSENAQVKKVKSELEVNEMVIKKKMKVKPSQSPEQNHDNETIKKLKSEKGQVQKKVKRKSIDIEDEIIQTTDNRKLKEQNSNKKPKVPIKRIPEQSKTKKRPLDSSDDEEELQDVGVENKVEVEDIPLLPKSLFSLTGDSVSAAAHEEESSDEEELNKGEVKKRRKVSRAQKQRDAKQLEEQLREAELSRLTKDTIGPQTEDDYRELLLTNKACSATWIQYISFLLAAGEHERARATARRGLSIIPFEEQKERVNLWIVLLRLEVMYGMDDSAAETALAEACSNADDYAILTNMADIYQENEMLDKAEEIHRRVTKKYYAELDAWVRMGQFCFSAGRLDDARATLAKALRVLKKKEGVDVTCRFAQLEHKYGDVDKSKSMFESLLANFPKRVDVWNVYVDLLIKTNDVEQARNVLSRMCCLQMRLVKKMSLFAKWRQFEQTHGTARTQEAAKRTIDELLMKEEAALDQ